MRMTTMMSSTAICKGLRSTTLVRSLYMGLAFAAFSTTTTTSFHRTVRLPSPTTTTTAAAARPSPPLGLTSLSSSSSSPFPAAWLQASSRGLATMRRGATVTTDQPVASDRAWKINLLYDSDCPLCMKEVEFLRKRDIMGEIKFTDLNDLDYRPEENGGVSFESGMKVIHAILPDGQAVKGVEVFRRVYDILGLGWVYAATRWPVIGPAVDGLYDLWAVNRLRITGRPDLEEILRERAEKLKSMQFDDCTDACDLPDDF